MCSCLHVQNRVLETVLLNAYATLISTFYTVSGKMELLVF